MTSESDGDCVVVSVASLERCRFCPAPALPPPRALPARARRSCQHKFAHRMDSAASTRPLCSSFLHVGLFWEGLGLQPFYPAAFFLEQVHNSIQLSFCYIFNNYGPALGCLLLYFLLTCSFINRCCQHKCAHRMDSAAMLSVVFDSYPSTL